MSGNHDRIERGRRRQVTAVILVVAGGLCCSGLLLAADLEVRRGTFSQRLVLTGELVAENAVQLVVPNANIWPVQVRWLAEDGIEVAEGETIVEFDNSQLAANLDQLEQAALEARNQLASLRAEARTQEIEATLGVAQKKAQLEIARIDAAVPEGLLAQKEYEERQVTLRRAELEFEQAERALGLDKVASNARVQKQRVALQKAEAAAEQAREGIDLLTLKAPRAGVLLVAENRWEGRPFQTGDASRPGSTVATLPELSSTIVEAWLYDVDDGTVRVGTLVTATVDAFPDELWSGRVTAIGSVASEISSRSLRRAFRVKIRLDDLDTAKMRPGMSVKAVLDSRLEDALIVPRAALRWREDDSKLVVEAVLRGGAAQPIDLGECNPQECVVLGGIEAGTALRNTSAEETSP